MLDLPGVTLCCIDTANHALALRALDRSRAGIRFARTLFITDRPCAEPGIEVAVVGTLDSREAYSRFVLKSLIAHIASPHVLLVQWDGYVVNPDAWRADFLDCDYIGATWFWHDDAMRVGNGGFSLRSLKLLDALQDPRIELTEAEDITICRAFRPLLERDYAIRFAPEPLADVFAFEAAYPIGRPFGFHGLFNFCRVVPPRELVELVAQFTPPIARSPQLLQLGRNCLALAQWDAAEAIFQRILDESPQQAQALGGLAAARSGRATVSTVGRNDPCPCGSGRRYKRCHGAIGSPAAPASATPAATESELRQALELHQRGDLAGAEAAYRAALAFEPDHALAQHYLGVIHYQRGELGSALPPLEAAADRSPNEPEFHNNMGLALAAADREADAVRSYRAALALKPDHAGAWNNLGLALQSRNDVAGAIDAFKHAVAIAPEFAHAHWNLALALLLDGQFSEGWKEYEWRLALPELGRGRHAHPGPLWDGGLPAGKTILVCAEQGLGDAIQFARYASLLARAGARVAVHCPEALRPLLASVPGVTCVVSADESLPHYDAHLPMLSLPRAFSTTLETIPGDVPYISVADDVRDRASAKIVRKGHRLTVGIAWAGSKEHSNDRNRSCALATLAPLFGIPDIGWFSLQQGDAARQIATVVPASGLVPLDADASLTDTAALIAELDMTVSVDTSIAHLAGALARPCRLMLPFAPDWRWMLNRADSPWYPSLRLVRQPRPREWSPVVEALGSELRDLARGKHRGDTA